MSTETEHQQAIDALASDPSCPHKAKAVLSMAAANPAQAAQLRERLAPARHGIPLDIVHERYDRHNLHMPERPRNIASPRTLDELQSTLQAAADAWQPAKAIGDGYGFANTGFTRGTLLPFVGALDNFLPIDTSCLRQGVDASDLVCFEAGATIGQLNHHLRAHGRALFNQPGFEGLTFVGTMSSGGHGSGTWTGALSSQVKALHMLTVDETYRVRQLRIEPENGISDRAKFSTHHPDIELIQDNRMFHSCTCAMGCLGVIYAVTIRTRNSYNIRETRKKHRWLDIRNRLPQLLADQGPGKRLHSLEVWINPYKVDGHVNCVLGEREETMDPPRGHRALAIEWGGAEVLYQLLSWWLQEHPDTLPALMDAALDATQASDVVMPSAEGLNFGGPNSAPVVAASGGIPAENIGAHVDKLIHFFQQQRRDEGRVITSPLGVRFVKATAAHLSPAHGRATCMVEVPILQGTPKAHETLVAYHDFIYREFGGRPHWGQINAMPGQRLRSIYPELDAFLESFRVLNPKGMFDNAFTEQMGFRNPI